MLIVKAIYTAFMVWLFSLFFAFLETTSGNKSELAKVANKAINADI